MTMVAGWISARGPLRAELTVDEAAAILWTVASPEVHRMFRIDWRWDALQYQRWLEATLAASLLPPSPCC
ncbi:MAG: hypothetical protein H0U51_06630 [Propionibacteriales bacterium]|nr:hypothetical protein [Propionibacteriales bacterium]